jgi:hypothetical protein
MHPRGGQLAAPLPFPIIGGEVTDPGILSAHRRAREEVEAMLLRYNATREFLTTRHLEALDTILDATSSREAEDRNEAAIKKIRTSLLAAWAGRKIPGVITPESVTKQATGAESLAKSFEKMALERGTEPGEAAKLMARAKKQRTRAEYLNKKAHCLRIGSPIPPPPILDLEEEEATPDSVEEKPKKPRKPRRPLLKMKPKRRSKG